MSFHVSPQSIRSHYLKRFNRDGVLLSRRLDSRLSKDLPSDLQKRRMFLNQKLLRALGAPGDARTYWAGGEPIGGKEALKPLTSEFLHLHNKYDVDCPMNSNLSQNELR
ncbi:hypothetical protein Bca4012_015469 [Brassica carinata]